MTLEQINEFASQLQHPDANEHDKERPVERPKTCIFGAVLDHTALVGGLRAGNFSHQGLTDSMDYCQRRCCDIKSCDIAIMMKGACFAVSCKKKSLCKPRKAHLASYSLLLSYRKRPGIDLSFEYENPNAVPTNDLVTTAVTETLTTITTDSTTKNTAKLPKQTKPTKTTVLAKGKVTTTRATETTKTTPMTTKKKQKFISDVDTVEPSKKPAAGIQSWCTTDFILEGVKLAGGLYSGSYHEIGRLDDINACVQRCCDTQDCTTAFIDKGTCFAFKCLDKDLCKSAIADSRSSVGYVIRDGWTLFKSAKEALSGAILSVKPTLGLHLQPIQNRTTENTGITAQSENDFLSSGLVVSGKGQSKSVNGSKPIPPPSLLHGSAASTVAPLPFPSSPQGENFGYCERGKTIINSRLVGGLGAGNFTDHGSVSDIETCTEYCCLDKECNLAYLVEETCYTVRCFSEELCQTFKAPGSLYNPILSYVYRNASAFASGDRKQGIGNNIVPGMLTAPLYNVGVSTSKIKDKQQKPTKHRTSHFPLHHSPTPSQKLRKAKAKQSSTIKYLKSKKLNMRPKKSKNKKKHIKHKHLNKRKKVPNQTRLHRIFDELMSDMDSGMGPLSVQKVKSKKKLSKHHSKTKGQLRSRLKTTFRPIHRHHYRTSPSSQTRVPIPLSKIDVATIESLSEDAPGEIDRCPARDFGCEHFCVSLNHGGHRCMCHKGFRLALDGRHCLEQEECDARSHMCEQYCIFEDGDFHCQCRSGYILNIANNTCDDINECTIGINGCDQICVNTPGSYRCICRNGYRLSDDRMTCEKNGQSEDITKKDKVERVPRFSIPATIVQRPNTTHVKQGDSIILDCAARGHPAPKVAWASGYLNRGPLPSDARFVVLPEGGLLIQNIRVSDQGYYQCIAINVAGADAAEALLKVEEVDLCKDKPKRCDQICKRSANGYQCGCYRGYSLTSSNHTCEDVDECSTTKNNCAHYCFNTQGSYVCGCKIGYRLHHNKRSCRDVDECTEGRHSCPQLCNNTNGSYRCTCFKGFQLQKDDITCLKTPMIVINGKHQVLLSIGFTALVSISMALSGVLCLTLLVLIRNYKKRLKAAREGIIEDPPVNIRSKSKAIFSWIE